MLATGCAVGSDSAAGRFNLNSHGAIVPSGKPRYSILKTLVMVAAGWPLESPILRLAVRGIVGGATFVTLVLAGDDDIRHWAVGLLGRNRPAKG